ncbi:IS3 family transposase [Mesorhizobium sp. J8]|nr:IS3 family transposase [Mesorhizobium sp. J8]
MHAKTVTSQQRRAVLTPRKLLQEKAIAIENDIRGLLRKWVRDLSTNTELKAERDILKKFPSLHRAGSDMRFAFIARHRNIWPVAWLCEIVSQEVV